MSGGSVVAVQSQWAAVEASTLHYASMTNIVDKQR